MNKPINLELDFFLENVKLSLSGKSLDCHNNSQAIKTELNKLGYTVRLVKGLYLNLPDKAIRHSWLEFENKILETDCKQLREEGDLMPNLFCAVLEKEKFKHRYLEGKA